MHFFGGYAKTPWFRAILSCAQPVGVSALVSSADYGVIDRYLVIVKPVVAIDISQDREATSQFVKEGGRVVHQEALTLLVFIATSLRILCVVTFVEWRSQRQKIQTAYAGTQMHRGQLRVAALPVLGRLR